MYKAPATNQYILPTAPQAAWEPEPFPHLPPYNAFLGNPTCDRPKSPLRNSLED